jgi:GNAT superfamily N-acetyltransferase
MSKFQLTLGMQEVAAQIANLINSGRQLYVRLTPASIISNSIRYIIELQGQMVVGVIGLDQVRDNVTEIKHLVVHPSHRNHGLGRKLLSKAVEAATTEFVYGMVRSDNLTNIRNNLRVGMRPIGKTRPHRGHRVIIFARRRHGNINKSRS